jgi:hypothetical protein
MSSRSISDLVNQVGVESSHAIVRHTSNEKIKGILDIQLWQHQPGEFDKLQIDDFFPWLQIWNELGPEFVSEKLEALGVEFVAVCFEKHISAFDTQVVGLAEGGEWESESAGHNFGRFDVIPAKGVSDAVNEEVWFLVLETLDHLQTHANEFLEAVLLGCSFVRSILREDVTEHHAPEEMQRDLGEERDKRAEHTGYITTTDAFAFLSITRSKTFEVLVLDGMYDELTRRYFRIPKEESGMDSENSEQPHNMDSRTEREMSSSETSPEELLQLKGILVELGINTERKAPQLLRPPEATPHKSLTHLLDQAMRSVQDKSGELFERRRDLSVACMIWKSCRPLLITYVLKSSPYIMKVAMVTIFVSK